MSGESAHQLLREASLELARLRRVRGAYRTTWRRIAHARRQLAFAAALLAAAPVAQPAAAAGDPLFQHGVLGLGVEIAVDAGMDFADLDGDGDFDLLTSGFPGMRFFENTGTAAAPALAAAQTNPFGLTSLGGFSYPSFGDLDGDGDLDLLVAQGTRSFHFANTGTPAAPAFAAPVTNPFGLASAVHELADLDGDGDLDAFRYATGGSPFIAFLENTGTVNAPAFAAPVLTPFGLAPLAFRFADLDGDGDLDALVGDGAGDTLLLENTGTATAPAFAAPATTPLGLRPLGWTDLVDLDGDGDFDAFTGGRPYFGAEFFAHSVFENVGGPAAPAFTNLGNPFGFGNFDVNAQAGYAYASQGSSAALADIDGDGDLDGFVHETGSYGSNLDTFLRNTGTVSAPAFAPERIAPLALGGNDPTLGDLDADGDTDALVGLASGDLLFFANTGAAGAPAFAAPATNPFGLAAVGASAAPDLADLDGDGDLDAFVGNISGDTLFFENTGTAASPAFAAASTNPFGLAGVAYAASPDFADIDGDGDLDASIGAFTGQVLFFANTGTAAAPAFAAPVANILSVVGYASPDLADIDGDGDLDVLVGNKLGTVSFFRNTGTANAPVFAAPIVNAFGMVDVGSYSAPGLGDVDGDGDLDAVVANLAGAVTFFENVRGPNTPLFLTPSSPEPFGIGVREANFVDIDGDGDRDLFSGTSFQENTGSVSAPAFANAVPEPFGLASAGAVSASRFADLDADGDLDALVGGADGNLIFFANTGSPTTPAFAAPATNPFGLSDIGGYATPDLADLDGDGDLDALIGAYDGNTRFFENTGSAAAPAFAAPLTNPFGLVDVGIRSSPEVSDVDGDGDLDVFVGDQLLRVVFFENVAIDEGACTDGLDNDGDGQLDLAADPGCASAADTSELGTKQCDNGQDDDGDGKIDWRSDASGDPHCASLTDNREAPDPATGCGLGPELLLLGPVLAAVRRRRGSYTAPSCPSPTPPPTSSSSAAR